MLQTFISHIARAAELGGRQRRRIPLRPRGGRSPWPVATRTGSAGGVGLRGRRPGLPASPRRALGDPAGAAAPLLLVSSHMPWVTGPRRSRGGAGSYSRLGGCWPFSLTAAAPRPLCSPPLRAARVPASLKAGARRLLPSPARPPGESRRPGLLPCTGPMLASGPGPSCKSETRGCR